MPRISRLFAYVLAFLPFVSHCHLVCYGFFGPVDDLGWTYVQNLARAWADEVLGTTSKYVENLFFQSPERQQEIMEGYMTDGCGLVVLGSETLLPLAADFGARYPDRKFIIVAGAVGVGLPPNVGIAYVRIHQASYIAGVVSAMQSPDSVVGYIGSMYAPDSLRCINAFALGMRSVNPNSRLYVQHVGSWFDPRAERIASLRMFDRYGVNIIGYDSDSTAVVAIAKAKGKKSIAMKSDGTALHGESNLMSAIFVWNDIFTDFINKSKGDMSTWQARKDDNLFVGFERSAVSLGTLSSAVPAATRLAVKQHVERFEKSEAVFCGTFASFCPEDGGASFSPCNGSISVRAPAPGEQCLNDDEVRKMSWLMQDLVVDLGLLQVPTECPPGTRLDALAAELCVPCDAGFVSTAVDSSVCTPCAAGYFNPSPGDSRCAVCSAGTFSDQVGFTACAQCQLGYTSSGAATACDACQAGKYGAADRTCQECPAGSFVNATGATECRACPAGSYSNRGAASCIPCLAGYFQAEEGGVGQESCEVCPRGLFASSSGATACSPCADGLTTENIASNSEDACVCREGSYRPLSSPAHICMRCPEGMTCPLGSEERFLFAEEGEPQGIHPYVDPGYYSPKEMISVYKCREDKRRCPGNKLDSCARGRHGLQCALCIEGWTKSASGAECEPCTSKNYWPIIVAAFAAAAALVLAYMWGSAEGVVKQSHAMALVALAGSQLVTVVQTLGAFSLMSISWPEPLASFLVALQVLNFNVEVLSIDCWISSSPLSLYVSQVMVVFTLLAGMLFVHFFKVTFFKRRRFRKHMPALINSVGLLVMVFFISIVTTMFAPLHCSEPHPNGVSTVGEFPTVICWSGGEHTSMLVIAAVVSILPIGFVIAAVWAIRVYPSRMGQGDIDFLASWSFLLFRFRSGAHWYAIIYLGRSVVIALVPVIPSAVAQLFCMTVVLIVSGAVLVRVQPWRVWHANQLDMFITGCLLLIINLASMFVDDVDGKLVAAICLALLGTTCVCLMAIVAYGAQQKLAQAYCRRKLFARFICHHKSGAGSFARLLKMVLTGSVGNKKVFIDSDDLTNLDALFDIVAHQTELLVVLCTPEILKRPWCVGEIATAKIAKVPTLRVIFPEYEEPTEEFVMAFQQHVPDAFILTERGIDIDVVQGALRWFRSVKSLTLPRLLCMGAVETLKTSMLFPDRFEGDRCLTSAPEMVDMRDKRALIVVDHRNSEAAATALILVLLLTPHFAHNALEVPIILQPERAVPKTTEVTLILCTKDAFSQPQVIRAVGALCYVGAWYVPVLCDTEFKVPTRTFFEENRELFQRVMGNAGQMMQLIKDIFKEIAVDFQPSLGASTDLVLRMKSSELASRLSKRHSLKQLRLKHEASFDLIIKHASTDVSMKRSSNLRASLEKSNEAYSVGGESASVHSDHGQEVPAGGASAVDIDYQLYGQDDEWLAPEEPTAPIQSPINCPSMPSRSRPPHSPRLEDFNGDIDADTFGGAPVIVTT